ncbi:Hypothetical protein PENO1_103140 [Penicillium occitanis (nom. inval.)]|nr:Hypothetical protein PENO1_103140 [Penicillium occitanis (nom. inval.)]PCG89717.1 hypothetical protein PENOC_105320 [Penicillium occitanis (nom. inval.)]
MDHLRAHWNPILQCVEAIRDGLPSPYIVVGGPSVVLLGGHRSTEEVDLLVPSGTDPGSVYADLQRIHGFKIINGTPLFRSNPGDTGIKVDILTNVVDRASYEDAYPYTMIVNGVLIFQLHFALGVKIVCVYLRQEDAIGYYHMIFLRISMVDDSTFQRLVALGLRKLLIPWEENTPEQREYYGLLTKEGTDPLTISLDTLGDD